MTNPDDMMPVWHLEFRQEANCFIAYDVFNQPMGVIAASELATAYAKMRKAGLVNQMRGETHAD